MLRTKPGLFTPKELKDIQAVLKNTPGLVTHIVESASESGNYYLYFERSGKEPSECTMIVAQAFAKEESPAAQQWKEQLDNPRAAKTQVGHAPPPPQKQNPPGLSDWDIIRAAVIYLDAEGFYAGRMTPTLKAILPSVLEREGVRVYEDPATNKFVPKTPHDLAKLQALYRPKGMGPPGT